MIVQTRWNGIHLEQAEEEYHLSGDLVIDYISEIKPPQIKVLFSGKQK
jgi:hypothetical protein